MEQVIVLNADYSFLNIVSWRRAITLMFTNKVEIVKHSTVKLLTASGVEFILPKIVRLVNFVNSVFKSKMGFSKTNVFIRDKFKCQYCGKTLKKPTIDHIIPKSRGGKNNFKNCVTCCKDCNQIKGNNTIQEAGMRLICEPKEPKVQDFLRLAAKNFGLEEVLSSIIK